MIVCLVAFLVSALLVASADWFELRRWRKSEGSHWTERARLLFPARGAALINPLLISGFVTLAAWKIDRHVSWWIVSLFAYLGTVVGAYPKDRCLYPWLTVTEWAHVAAAALVQRAVRWLPLAWAALFMPAHADWRMAAIVAGYTACYVTLQLGLGVWLLRALRLLRPASPRLAGIVAQSSALAGVFPRAVWEIVSLQANALAVVTSKELMFTTRLLDVMPDDELRAICAHELGHLTESRWVLAARLVRAWSLTPLIFIRPAQGTFGPVGVVALLATMIGLWILCARISRAMERRADRVSTNAKEDGPVYARALERMYAANQIPAVMRSRALATHPNLYDRLLAAGITPEYPRPNPPQGVAWSTSLFTAVATILTMSIVASARRG